MNFAIKPGYDRPEEVKELFIEYTDMLVKGAKILGKVWDHNHIENYI